MGRRFAWREVPAYVVAQVVGAILAAGVLFVIASGLDSFDAQKSGFATNGYGDHSPAGYSLLAVIVAEVVLTAFFLYVILGVTDDQFRVLVAQIGGVDHVDRRPHCRLGGGCIDERGDHIVEFDRSTQPDDRVVQVGSQLCRFDIGDQHCASHG